MKRMMLFIVFISGIIVGFSSAFFTLKVSTVIDYKSCEVRRIIKIGPFIARNKVDLRYFPLFSSTPPIIESKKEYSDWHTLEEFYGNSGISPIFYDEIETWIGYFTILFPNLKRKERIEIKNKFIDLLSSEGEGAAISYAQNILDANKSKLDETPIGRERGDRQDRDTAPATD